YCSYCVVPFVRGVEKNLDYDTIVNKCFSAVKNGIKEITFIGQNVNSYKCNGINFSLLLKNISLIKNLERIRFITNHPKDFSDELINTIATNSKICSHIHLPMQSASNKILQLMNRKYTYEYYLNLIKKLRFSIPDVNITTDIIVGFPGETREDFNCTLNAVKNLKFGWLYVFKYSRRQNTYAFDMNDNISVKEKEIRHFIILNEASKISSKITLNMVGNKYQVLVEKINGNFMESKTRNGYKVFLKINEKHYGKIVNVIVKNANTHSLFGNVIDE
ncbi:MAG: MiaB/RimO family radical SAM methylthiotransferase, partial [Endomicrobium sp.]|nr:MiaB/RimO family radical SAM methylthiotransferase [Endomicrobium sp.]